MFSIEIWFICAAHNDLALHTVFDTFNLGLLLQQITLLIIIKVLTKLGWGMLLHSVICFCQLIYEFANWYVFTNWYTSLVQTSTFWTIFNRLFVALIYPWITLSHFILILTWPCLQCNHYNKSINNTMSLLRFSVEWQRMRGLVFIW